MVLGKPHGIEAINHFGLTGKRRLRSVIPAKQIQGQLLRLMKPGRRGRVVGAALGCGTERAAALQEQERGSALKNTLVTFIGACASYKSDGKEPGPGPPAGRVKGARAQRLCPCSPTQDHRSTRGGAGQPQAAAPRRAAEPGLRVTLWQWQTASPPRWCRSQRW